MQLGIRPYVTTGVAIVGAGVIAVAPVTMPPPDLEVPPVHAAEVAPAALATDLATALANVMNQATFLALGGGGDSLRNAIEDGILAATAVGASAGINATAFNDAISDALGAGIAAINPVAALVPVLGPATANVAWTLLQYGNIAVDDMIEALILGSGLLATELPSLVNSTFGTAVPIGEFLGFELGIALVVLAEGIDAGTPVSGGLAAAAIMVDAISQSTHLGLQGLNFDITASAGLATQFVDLAENRIIEVAGDIVPGLQVALGQLAPAAALLPVVGPAAIDAATQLLGTGLVNLIVGLPQLSGAINQGITTSATLVDGAIDAVIPVIQAVSDAIVSGLGTIDAVTPLAATAGPESLPAGGSATVAVTTHDGGATSNAAGLNTQPGNQAANSTETTTAGAAGLGDESSSGTTRAATSAATAQSNPSATGQTTPRGNSRRDTKPSSPIGAEGTANSAGVSGGATSPTGSQADASTASKSGPGGSSGGDGDSSGGGNGT